MEALKSMKGGLRFRTTLLFAMCTTAANPANRMEGFTSKINARYNVNDGSVSVVCEDDC